jgi:beta-1,4-mannosyl-glycoprotein beta-1,4-N-acetylglucosaminyltransferase
MIYHNLNIKLYKTFILFIFLCCSTLFVQIPKFRSIPNTNNKNIQNNNISDSGRIFLCTLYNNEVEQAYILIWRLYDFIDKFILVISNITHSNQPKNFTFKSFEKNIQKYMDKIDIVHFNNVCNKIEYPQSDKNWCIESSQRDYAKAYIDENYNPTNKDLLIVADLDEILTREGIQYIKKHPPKNFYFIKGAMYFPYYYHRLENWNKVFVIRYNKTMKSFTKLRLQKVLDNITLKYKYNPSKPLMTHCSYCFKDIEEYKNKLKSFAHQEFNQPPYITNNWIFKSHYCREKIKSPRGNDETYEGWQDLIPDDERLKYLIDRSYKYNLNETNFTISDLETLCNKTYNRTPFESSAIYKP